jgi:hypothetical protein
MVRFVLGGLAVLVLLWVPVLVTAWSEFSSGVLGYRGISMRQWGLAELLEGAGHLSAEVWLAEHGSWAVVAAALVPAVVWATRPPHEEVVGLGMSLVTMLVLSPAFGMQYLSWALAAAYLVSIRSAWLYNAAASAFVLSVYSAWSGGGPPWSWEEARGMPFTVGQLMLMAVTWASLVVVWVDGLWGSVRARSGISREELA